MTNEKQDTDKAFFENVSNLTVVNKFLNRTQTLELSDEIDKARLGIVRSIIHEISQSPQEWDRRCTFNITHIGRKFVDKLSTFSDIRGEDHNVGSLYTSAVRFILEYDFKIPTNRNQLSEIDEILSAIHEDFYRLAPDSSEKRQLMYAFNIMPISIMQRFFTHKNVTAAFDFKDRLDDAERLKKEWDAELETKEKAVGELSTKLDRLTTAYNFVGLYQGFDKLSEDKKNEQKWLFRSLVGMAILILTPLVVEFMTLTFGGATKTFDGVTSLVRLMPLVSIEVILIYFFRIILMNYRSVKTQVMQIELRKTLCSFIQGYADYAKGIKEKDADLLDRFENLIFSGILSDSEKLPSTFDGLEQLGNMIKNIKR
ncbi:hypothetical protein AB4125_06025 [Vibrio splendidus]